MSNLKINTSSGSGHATILPPTVVEGRADLVQRAIVRLELFLGEWPFDDEVGVDWEGFTSSKEADQASVAAVIRRELDKVDGLANIEVNYDESNLEQFTVELGFDDDVPSATLTASLDGNVYVS